MPESRKDGNGSKTAALSRFIADRVTPISQAFASTPLMELRVRSSEGSVRLVKAPDGAAHTHTAAPAAAKPHKAPKPHLSSEDSGQPYDVISAEVVGIFTAVPDLPAEGERVDGDRVLGSVEALKLKHPVRTGGPCVFIAQVAEDGQAVDFGEALFVVDRGEKRAREAPIASDAPAEMLEPPRL